MLDISTKLVERLIAEQFPQWSNLIVTPVSQSGHDNRTFRLGTELTVRLPSGGKYVAQVEKEQLYLPKLSHFLSLPISVPVAKGNPVDDYPFPWSINRWIGGETARHDRIVDMNQFAVDVAHFLKELQAIATDGGPVAGEHNFYRGGCLAVYHHETLHALEGLESVLPVCELRTLWQRAMQSTYKAKNIWIHGDVAPGNILVAEGKLCGVIDFGMMGTGDPACDYALAWTFFDSESRNIFFNALDCDAETVDRARGWALWKALITYNDANINFSENAKYTLSQILNESTAYLFSADRVSSASGGGRGAPTVFLSTRAVKSSRRN